MEEQKLARLTAIPGLAPGAIGIATVGGVAAIGMNWTLVGHGDGWVLVDAGTTFAPRDTVGVGVILPDPRLFAMLGSRLKGLVVTHAHEDHIGAIHRMWPKYARCPIHAPPFAARMLGNRLQEAGTRGKVDVRTYRPGDTITVGPFSIATVKVAHSTPDCAALAFSAGGRTVLHTGDWKIDPQPGIGSTTDMAAMARLGRKGVDLMLCDSTNADREAAQTSEASVRRAMERVFARAKGMVYVCSFGSNVARMASVAHAAKATRRKVALAGRSLRNAAEIAEVLGLMKDVPPFLKDGSRFGGTERRGCVLMCTGTQGEENAALAKLAADRGDDDRLPRVRPGDVVIHSARTIPGNEDYVQPILEKLRALGARIVAAGDTFEGDPVHVTGHPCRQDLREMYAAVRPRIAMPVHGTPAHLEAHAALARELGVEGTTVPVAGGFYELGDDGLRPIGRLDLGLVAIMEDGDGTLVAWDEATERPVLLEADLERLAAHVERERERAERRSRRQEMRGAVAGRDGRSAETRPAGGRLEARQEGEGRRRRRGGRRHGAGATAERPPETVAAKEGGRHGRDAGGNGRPASPCEAGRPPAVKAGAAPDTLASPTGAPRALDRSFIASIGGYREIAKATVVRRPGRRDRRGAGGPGHRP